MRRIHVYSILLITLLVACTPGYDKTIANLKTAIDDEATAHAKHTMFAEQAAKDSLYPIEALFKAVAQAETIHIKNYKTVLASLGIADYQPQIQQVEIKSTSENLQTAIDGETHQFTVMYPKFIEDAQAEKRQDALITFNYAKDAKKDHVRIYTYILGNIKSPAVLSSVYYLCPKCGNVYIGTTTKECDICGTSANLFIESKANTILIDAMTGATSKRMNKN